MKDGVSRENAILVVQKSANLLKSAASEVGALEILGGAALTLLGVMLSIFRGFIALENGREVAVGGNIATILGLIGIARGIRIRKTQTRGHLREVIFKAREAALDSDKLKRPADEARTPPRPPKQYDY